MATTEGIDAAAYSWWQEHRYAGDTALFRDQYLMSEPNPDGHMTMTEVAAMREERAIATERILAEEPPIGRHATTITEDDVVQPPLNPTDLAGMQREINEARTTRVNRAIDTHVLNELYETTFAARHDDIVDAIMTPTLFLRGTRMGAWNAIHGHVEREEPEVTEPYEIDIPF